jgi:hypothetical protein
VQGVLIPGSVVVSTWPLSAGSLIEEFSTSRDDVDRVIKGHEVDFSAVCFGKEHSVRAAGVNWPILHWLKIASGVEMVSLTICFENWRELVCLQ